MVDRETLYPFYRDQVNAPERFESDFMVDYLRNKKLSTEAKAVDFSAFKTGYEKLGKKRRPMVFELGFRKA